MQSSAGVGVGWGWGGVENTVQLNSLKIASMEAERRRSDDGYVF
jgi:hypothetical protein